MKAARFVVSLLFPLVLLPPNAAAGIVSVENLRQWRAPDHTRLVFDLSAPLEHRLFTLRDPHRVVIDMDNARLTGAFPELDKNDTLLAAVRNGRTDAHTLRIVLDLKHEARARTFVLKPAGQYGHRLVIDLYDAEQDKETSRKPPAAAFMIAVPVTVSPVKVIASTPSCSVRKAPAESRNRAGRSVGRDPDVTGKRQVLNSNS